MGTHTTNNYTVNSSKAKKRGFALLELFFFVALLIVFGYIVMLLRVLFR